MQPNETAKLDDFVAATKSKGASDEFLAAFLTRRAGPPTRSTEL